jgi:hypothetical protein
MNSTLVAGHGIWGNLKRVGARERGKAGRLIAKAKRVLPYVNGKPLHRQGLVGASPEIYHQLDAESAHGLVIGFSGSAIEYSHRLELRGERLLGVLNHSYRAERDSLFIDMQFTMPDDTREAFVLGNDGRGVTVLSSSGWLEDLRLEDGMLEIVTGSRGVLQVRMPDACEDVRVNVPFSSSDHVLTIENEAEQTITIRWR